MRRLSLFFLVFILLMFNVLMGQMETFALHRPELYACYLHLPAALGAAGLGIAALGMGAQFWLCTLPLCGAEWFPKPGWERLSAAGLWCGWLPMLCAAPYYSGSDCCVFSQPLFIGFVGILLSRLVHSFKKHWFANIFGAIFAGAAALLCGMQLWPSAPLSTLVLGLMCAPALHLLVAHSVPRPLVWLYIASLLFCAYSAAFGHLLAFYPPCAGGDASPWGMVAACLFVLCAMLLIIATPLRRSLVGCRGVAALGLLLGVAWLALHLLGHLPPQASVVGMLLSFFLSLAALSLPLVLMLLPARAKARQC